MVPQPRTGSFSPNPAAQTIYTGLAQSPLSSLPGALSAGASPSTSSPTGNTLTKIAVAQVYLLLSTIKEDKDDPHKWDAQTESLQKVCRPLLTPRILPAHEALPLSARRLLIAFHCSQLIDDHGMDVFTRYFSRLVATNAAQIFPSLNRAVAPSNANNYHLLVAEMRKLSHDFKQARQIAESIETGTEDIFRDFDLSTFMEHFGLDALEKTLLSLAFKLGPRTDLKTKGILRLSCSLRDSIGFANPTP